MKSLESVEELCSATPPSLLPPSVHLNLLCGGSGGDGDSHGAGAQTEAGRRGFAEAGAGPHHPRAGVRTQREDAWRRRPSEE